MVGERGVCETAQERLTVLVPAHRRTPAGTLQPCRVGCLPPVTRALTPKAPVSPLSGGKMGQQERPQGILVLGFTWSQTEMSWGPGTAVWILGDLVQA